MFDVQKAIETAATVDPLLAVLARLGLDPAARGEPRLAVCREAVRLGATDAVVKTLWHASRIARAPTVTLPLGKYAGCARGKSWCRLGRGPTAQWMVEGIDGYSVGPGKYNVGSTDGYNRRQSDDWVVRHVRVGNETWTVAT